jgi:flagellar biosynthesis component FlhA
VPVISNKQALLAIRLTRLAFIPAAHMPLIVSCSLLLSMKWVVQEEEKEKAEEKEEKERGRQRQRRRE